jgi:DNA-nicking Smr family endonuclease
MALALSRAVDRLLGLLLQRAAAATPARVPVLDLHGLGVRDALAATERFLRDAIATGTREVRIVYGKGRGSPGGRGVLREVVPRWLADEGRRYVTAATPEPDATGADGAIRVRLAGPGSRS